jgi:hypothetical protein
MIGGSASGKCCPAVFSVWLFCQVIIMLNQYPAEITIQVAGYNFW